MALHKPNTDKGLFLATIYDKYLNINIKIL